MDAAEPSSTQGNVMRLLYKAVKALPEDEQAAVFAYFVGLAVAPRQQAALGLARAASDPGFFGSGGWPGSTFFATQKGAGPNQQLIPVRLSEDSHRRLKQWCADHDFHMSVVVRGLIERFLDGWQEPEAPGPADAAR